MTSNPLQRNTLIGLVASVVLSITKLLAGVFGRSTALVADAVESLADVIGSIFVWQALRVADRPPDDQHPYGYGKAEALSSIGVGLLLIGAAIFIVIKSFHEIVVPHAAPESWTLIVLLGVIVVKEVLFRLIIRGADELQSDAARADAWHHRSDAITSAAALIGVSVAVWGPGLFGIPNLVLADEAAAILASGVIIITAMRLIKPALRELLDAVSPDMVKSVTTIAQSIDGVKHVEKVWVRKSGMNYHVDMHLHVNPDLTIRVAHALSGKVKSILKAEIPNLRHVLIHIEPSEEPLASAR